MKEKWNEFKNKIVSMWQNSSTKQKAIYCIGILFIMIIIISIAFVTSNTKYVALPYTNLSIEEVAQIKEELDGRGITYELDNGGTIIKVPEEESDQLLVDLAGQGIPRSGSIDYSFFSENASWGVTDNEFNMMKLDAMQTELANLMKGIDGIEDANVMITLPKESVFLSDVDESASASIVLQTDLGFEFKGNQIETLHHLVSAAIPNLPSDNIVIMNQYFEYFDAQSTNVAESDYEFQQNVKKDIERDIQKRLQQMLGAMVGIDRVVVSVTADVDYTNENRIEELVEPVDVDNMEGIPVSIENLHETFEGNQAAGGVVGTGEEDVPNYPAGTNEDGDYELVKETINYELNRIHREIAETPYKLRDLGIQVVVDNVLDHDGDDVVTLSQQEQSTVEDSIASILNSMITTSIDKEYGEIEPEEKVSIVFQPFNGSTQPLVEGKPTNIPTWVYVTGIVIALLIIGLIIFFRKRRKDNAEQEDVSIANERVNATAFDVQNIEELPKKDSDVQKEQLEKMAKEKPEDFAKLLRSWISED